MNNIDVIEELYSVILNRKKYGKENSYTNYLFEKGIDKILKKVGEETTEVIVAAKNANKDDLVAEICDVIYHMIVLMVDKEVSLEEIRSELNKRRKKIGNKKPERRKIENI
ncbi:phosphoribosyl-ATP pyrophosphatase [Clostridium novyi A str. 4552]|uniref:Phosphoribosyl-ATP pyrophosphatase n=1 Tax=Clostridium novyi A str. 4552 TaxID=1444289 RepID=A0A0A0I4S9_CLONO|nr:phosphoribosyl-ATP diphosphatase [Clostridium novyi]KGM95296.1 phosphoribosyl-ATP pyrophosphatase [Clostridium novyi A str. 4552]